jgi:hypothetical protein
MLTRQQVLRADGSANAGCDTRSKLPAHDTQIHHQQQQQGHEEEEEEEEEEKKKREP